MMPTNAGTLTQYLIELRRHKPQATGDFNELILQVALACRSIAKRVAHGTLRESLGGVIGTNVQGEDQKAIDALSNEIFLATTEWTGVVSGMVSEEMEDVYRIPAELPRGKYLLLFDPLDGSSNIDVNVAVGSIFSILRAPRPGEDPSVEDFLQPGTEQVAAGYAIYGPATMLVLTVGEGVVGFTLDPETGDFFMTHPDIRVPENACEFAINASNSRFWEAPIKRYVEECLAGKTGPRSKDFNMRWIASLVAETHRILMRGGVFMYPRDMKDPMKPGRLRLLYECNPIGMIIEQAGGRASTGEIPMLEAQPSSLHQRIGFVFGSRNEVELIEHYHAHPQARSPEPEYDTQLFGERGLFREWASH